MKLSLSHCRNTKFRASNTAPARNRAYNQNKGKSPAGKWGFFTPVFPARLLIFPQGNGGGLPASRNPAFPQRPLQCPRPSIPMRGFLPSSGPCLSKSARRTAAWSGPLAGRLRLGNRHDGGVMRFSQGALRLFWLAKRLLWPPAGPALPVGHPLAKAS